MVDIFARPPSLSPYVHDTFDQAIYQETYQPGMTESSHCGNTPACSSYLKLIYASHPKKCLVILRQLNLTSLGYFLFYLRITSMFLTSNIQSCGYYLGHIALALMLLISGNTTNLKLRILPCFILLFSVPPLSVPIYISRCHKPFEHKAL